MKKFYFCFLLFMASISVLNASGMLEEDDATHQVIDLQYHRSIRIGIPEPRPRTPANPPMVYQNNYTIIFEISGFCSSVSVIDIESDNVVYEVLVLDSETEITLPQNLQGEYEIRFNRDSYYYSGIIYL